MLIVTPVAIVELVGLPGAGKTEACKALLARAADARRSRVSASWRGLRRSVLPRLLLPLTMLRYRRVIRALRVSEGRRWPRARAALCFLTWRAKRLRKAESPLVSTLYLLTTFVTEMALARLEARLRRRALIVDEGPVHRLLGVWTRTEPPRRDAVLAAYLDTMPPSHACIRLRCAPETACARALGRRRGIPHAALQAARRIGGDREEEAPTVALYREQDRLFDRAALRERVRMREVDASGTPDETAAAIESALEGVGGSRRLLIFLRE